MWQNLSRQHSIYHLLFTSFSFLKLVRFILYDAYSWSCWHERKQKKKKRNVASKIIAWVSAANMKAQTHSWWYGKRIVQWWILAPPKVLYFLEVFYLFVFWFCTQKLYFYLGKAIYCVIFYSLRIGVRSWFQLCKFGVILPESMKSFRVYACKTLIRICQWMGRYDTWKSMVEAVVFLSG